MATIYVAGKNLERARAVMDMLVAGGHTIAFDWVVDIADEQNDGFDFAGRAQAERWAVQKCDLLVYLWETDQESARYEAGMAMGLNKPIIVSGFKKRLFFLGLPDVVSVGSDDEILGALNSLYEQKKPKGFSVD